MFRRRKRKNNTVNGDQPEPPPHVPNSTAPTSVTFNHKAKASPLLTDAFKGAIEKAADWPCHRASEGTIKPMAFFVHADNTMKSVSLSHSEMSTTKNLSYGGFGRKR